MAIKNISTASPAARAAQNSPATPTNVSGFSAKSKAAVHKRAVQIATAATHWRYDTGKARRTGGTGLGVSLEDSRQFDRNHLGICVDMAVEASEMFTKAGIESRVVGGHDFTTGGNHAWVEYRQSGNSGPWVRFDPTAAASGKKAIYAFNNKWLRCGKPFEIMGQWVPADQTWETKNGGQVWKWNKKTDRWVDQDGLSIPGKDL